jgi:hypothetical protein
MSTKFLRRENRRTAHQANPFELVVNLKTANELRANDAAPILALANEGHRMSLSLNTAHL